MKLLSLAVVVFAQIVFANTEWNIDSAHSTAKFKVRHLGISNVFGQITGAKGTVTADDKDVTKLQMNATLDVATINTNDAKRDAHLKNADFFDVEKHPTITFKSKKVNKGKGGKLSIMGDLTMHGITKEVVLNEVELTAPVKDPWGGTRRGLSGTTKINRKDYGIVWNKTLDNGGLAVGDTVEVNMEVELIASNPSDKKS